MNSPGKNLTAAAWSKLESLSSLRRFLQKELDHSHQFDAFHPDDRIVEALHSIDSFSAEISRFLQFSNEENSPFEIENSFDDLSARYQALMDRLEKMVTA